MASLKTKHGFVVLEKELRGRKVKYFVVDNVPECNLHIEESNCDSTSTQSSWDSTSKQSSCDSTLLDFSCISTSTEYCLDSVCPNFDYEKVKIKKTKCRKSRKRSFLPMLVEEDNIIPSAYELQRERNIQENHQLLKLLSSQNALEWDIFQDQIKQEKRRKCIISPLPPPRPKSMKLQTKELINDNDSSTYIRRHSCGQSSVQSSGQSCRQSSGQSETDEKSAVLQTNLNEQNATLSTTVDK